MENMKLGSYEPVVYIKEEHTNISALNPIDLNIQDEEDEIGDKSEHKVYCSLTVVNPEEITYDSLGPDDYNSDWVFGLQTSDGSHNQPVTINIKNNESSQQTVIECDLSNDSTYSRLNDNSSSDNSSMYTYYSLPNDSSLVSFSHQESPVNKRVDFNEFNNKRIANNVPEPKKVVTKVVTKVEKSPPVKKTFACPICNKVFASKSNLERHGVVHSDVKPFQCVECKRMFSRRVHLERHKFLHTDQKPFNCEICKKGFTQKSHLEKHQYIHTGVKPFPCLSCEKTFARKESLNRHKLTHAVNEKMEAVDNKGNNSEKKTINQDATEKKKIAGNMDTKTVKVKDDVNSMKSKIESDRNKVTNSPEKERTTDVVMNDKTHMVIKQEVVIKEEIDIKEEMMEETNNYEQMDIVGNEIKTE